LANAYILCFNFLSPKGLDRTAFDKDEEDAMVLNHARYHRLPICLQTNESRTPLETGSYGAAAFSSVGSRSPILLDLH
jgi:hypothetical protein